MLAVGRALMSRPKLMMMDEPSLGLAPIVVKGILEIIREIDRQMSTLNQERMQLRETEIDELQKKLRVTVGLCFRLPNGDCVKIIDVPQKQYTMMRTEFNEYQLPVLKVLAKGNTGKRLQGYDLMPLEEDTLFPGRQTVRTRLRVSLQSTRELHRKSLTLSWRGALRNPTARKTIKRNTTTKGRCSGTVLFL